MIRLALNRVTLIVVSFFILAFLSLDLTSAATNTPPFGGNNSSTGQVCATNTGRTCTFYTQVGNNYQAYIMSLNTTIDSTSCGFAWGCNSSLRVNYCLNNSPDMLSPIICNSYGPGDFNSGSAFSRYYSSNLDASGAMTEVYYAVMEVVIDDVNTTNNIYVEGRRVSIDDFHVSPLTITVGQTARIYWETTNILYASDINMLGPGGVVLSSGAVDEINGFPVTPSAPGSYIYRLDAYGPAANTAFMGSPGWISESITLQVNDAPPDVPIGSIWTNVSSCAVPCNYRVSYSSSYVSTCVINNEPGAVLRWDLGSSCSSGFRDEVTINTPGTYTYSLYGNGSELARTSVNVSSGGAGVCGNGVLDPGEQCDLGGGNGPPPSACSSSCTNNSTSGTITALSFCNGTRVDTATPITIDYFLQYPTGTYDFGYTFNTPQTFPDAGPGTYVVRYQAGLPPGCDTFVDVGGDAIAYDDPTYGRVYYIVLGASETKSFNFNFSGPPPSISFSCSPNPISYSGNGTLTWSSVNMQANSCNITGGPVNGASSGLPTSGSVGTGALTANTSYSISCMAYNGSVYNENTGCTVEAPAVPVVDILCDGAQTCGATPYNGSRTLTWSVTNGVPVTGCTVSGAWSGSRPATGPESTGLITSDRSWDIYCSNLGGNGPSDSVSATVPDPEADIKCDGGSGPTDGACNILYGESASIRWCGGDSHACANASTCVVTRDGVDWSIGPTSGLSSTGAQTVTGTHTYGLRCSGNGTSIDSPVQVIVANPTLSVAPSTIYTGGTVSATWTGVSSTRTTDWIGLYTPGAPNNAPLSWVYTSSCATTPGFSTPVNGNCPAFLVSQPPGTYELRLLYNNNSDNVMAYSNTFTVVAGPTLSASPSAIYTGDTLSVTWTGASLPPPSSTNWIGLYTPGAPNNAPLSWVYANSCTTTAGSSALANGNCPAFLVSNPPGTYELRLLYDNQYDISYATSNTITVFARPTLSVSPLTIYPGDTVSATWSGVVLPTPLSTTNWIGLYNPGGPDNVPLSWVYTNSCTTTAGSTTPANGNCPAFLVSNPPGTYELRLFYDNQYSPKLATSNTFTVIVLPPTVANVTFTEPNYCASGPGGTLSWQVTNGGPQTSYEAQIDDDPGFGSPAVNQTITTPVSFAAISSGLAFNTTYYARVRVWNAGGAVSNWVPMSGCFGPGCQAGNTSWRTPIHAYPDSVNFTNAPTNPAINSPVSFTGSANFAPGSVNRSWIWQNQNPTSVTWTNVVGVTPSGNSLTKPSGAALGWDAGAVSNQRTSGDGYVEFSTSETNTAKIGGLSLDSPDSSYPSIDYAIDPWMDGRIYIYENGTCKYGGAGCIDTSSTLYAAGDLFRVAIESGAVKYYRNGRLIYTSLVPPSVDAMGAALPMLFDSSFSSPGATINNVRIGNTPNPPYTFTAPGSYPVTLTVRDDAGSCATTRVIDVQRRIPRWIEVAPR